MKILITGGSGFIGAHLAKYALDNNNMQTESLAKAVDVLREINSPKQLREATREQENHAVRLTTIEGQTIPAVLERVAKLEHQHNGRHPPII